MRTESMGKDIYEVEYRFDGERTLPDLLTEMLLDGILFEEKWEEGAWETKKDPEREPGKGPAGESKKSPATGVGKSGT